MVSTPTVERRQIDEIAWGNHGDPFAVLGQHQVEVAGRPAVAVRTFQPGAEAVSVIEEVRPGTIVETPMERLHTHGFFEAIFTDRRGGFPYRLKVTRGGEAREIYDPYAFQPLMTEYDRYLIGEGTHYRSFDRLGAHPRVVEGIAGTAFAVWAPNALRVSVIGDFNNWDERAHPMRRYEDTGVWDLFIPGIGPGTLYKYAIHSRYASYHVEKADPYGFAAEIRPQTASIVTDLSRYEWGDGEWIAQRERRQALDAPIAIYEVHLGSWRRVPEDNGFLSYRDLAHQLVDHVKRTGFTHIELLPITEHPFDGSWGYQTIGYYAPTSRHGSPDDFRYFVDYCHQNGIGVILVWVPAHFPKDAAGLNFFDGTHLYEHADRRLGEHPDWGTLIFNFGRIEVLNFLISNALFWIDQYHIDGLRVDAVASMLYLDYSREEGAWLPNRYGGKENLEAIAFLKRFNEVVHERFPGVLTIAEESTAWPQVSRPTYLGGLGFSLKWNMGWMHDVLRYVHHEPIYRSYHHNDMTFALMYAFAENFVLPFSHDEVVHGKGSMLTKIAGDWWQQFATLRALYGFMWGHPGKKLLFMGNDFGQWDEWDSDRSLDWDLATEPMHAGLLQYLADINRLYHADPALHQVDFDPAGFEWIDADDRDNSIFSFMRRSRDGNPIIVVVNFTPIARHEYRIGVPDLGRYREVINSDAEAYGGGN
ncbi:MAG TPA: 1,4-alpha-glucan branching protein GlgB, partial [Dehalococcoidia bacterium]|nr:1,4-alpha-glucan branching protein GlgB [Dehalococcoidia bacterium]